MPWTNEYVPVSRLATQGVVDEAEEMAWVHARPERTRQSIVGVRALRRAPVTASARRQSINRKNTFGRVMFASIGSVESVESVESVDSTVRLWSLDPMGPTDPIDTMDSTDSIDPLAQSSVLVFDSAPCEPPPIPVPA